MAFSAPPASAATFDSTVLVLAANAADVYSASSGLNGYGIPYQAIILPQYNATLPTLNSSASHGNYGGIITIGELYYSGSGSALSADQWNTIYAYQLAFGARLVRLGATPSTAFGVALAGPGGCCDTNIEQNISISDTSFFSTANLVKGAALSSMGLYHYPAVITSPSNTQEVAQYGPSSDGVYNSSTSAAVINNFDGRQQMVFFSSWATQWSQTCNLLQHAYIHWLTRGLFVGSRKLYFLTQVDDVHLDTGLYSPQGSSFRLRPDDLSIHAKWQSNINARLPSGSRIFLELAHNGNGDIDNVTRNDGHPALCSPNNAIQYPAPPATPEEFQKPLNTGSNVWPPTPANYTWSRDCALLDPLATWFTKTENRDNFSHLSHTFTHLSLNNATYSDALKEITFNNAWLRQLGLDQGVSSPNGLVPPAITGVHNGDAIRAWAENGITAVVGDNSRSALNNPRNEFWPLYSTVAANGYDGLLIMPRWPTRIYFNCDLPDCDVKQWSTSFGGVNDFKVLLDNERTTNTRNLLALRQDPFMFHQANMRVADVPVVTIGTITAQLSMLQSWIETITQEMGRLTDWPLVTLKHDDIAKKFADRKTRDECVPSGQYVLSPDRKQITHIVVSATNANCAVPIGVTLPLAATGNDGTNITTDKLGSEPAIDWISLSGQPVTLSLSSALAV